MSVVNAREFELAFSLNKQSALITGVTASQVNKALPQRGFAPSMQEFPAQVSDRNWYGKGHSFPTFRDIIYKRLVVPAREFSMSQLSALYAPAFVLGNLSTSQPNSASAPTVYDHTLTFQDPGTNPNCLFTSMIEKAGAEYQNLISGLVINSFTVRGERNDHVVLGWEGFARTMTSDATTLPALAASQSFFKLLKCDVRFGSSGGSYATNVSGEVLSLNLNVTQNAKGFWLPGAASGSEELLSKVLIGDQAVSGSLTMFLDATRRSLFTGDTECELKITMWGSEIGATGYRHMVTITLPRVKGSAEGFSEVDGTTAYTFTFDENSVLKGSSDEFIQWTVRSNIDASELLVAA